MASDGNPGGYQEFLRNMYDMVHYELKSLLLTLCDDEIFAIWQHICDENFHPDTEFGRFNLEDRMTADEFIGLIAEAVDERRRQSTRLSIAI